MESAPGSASIGQSLVHTQKNKKPVWGWQTSPRATASVNSPYSQGASHARPLSCGTEMGLIRQLLRGAINLHLGFDKITNRTSSHQHVQMKADSKTLTQIRKPRILAI